MLYDAEHFAKSQHHGQMYGDKSYDYHLQQVVDIVERYSDEQHLIDAAWLHDVIEDTGITYFDVARKFGVSTANIVWACTGVGRNRTDRQGAILLKLPIFPGAPVVKLADRMANMQAGIDEGNKDKFLMYAREHYAFGPVIAQYVPSDMYREYLAIHKKGIQQFTMWDDSWQSRVDRFYIK